MKRPLLVILLHLAVIALLLAANYVLPAYHRQVLSRGPVIVFSGMGYNLLMGYTGLLSLGHAMYFAAGLYGAGMTMLHLGWSTPAAFGAGVATGVVLALVTGVLALRTTGVAFMIVTMMFAQVFYLATLYFSEWTRGDEGIVLPQPARIFDMGGFHFDPTNALTRYAIAAGLFSLVLLLTLALARSGFGRVMVAIRENEERTRMLGYNVFARKLIVVMISGAVSAAAGAAYALLFGYVGSTFASVQYSILPLLWVLIGGAATTLGPLIGTVAMTYLVDYSSSALARALPDWNISYLGVVGIALIVVVLFFPKGILGTIRERWAKWLP